MSVDKMKIRSKDLGNGKFNVEGIIFYADTMIEAIRKYLRAKKETT